MWNRIVSLLPSPSTPLASSARLLNHLPTGRVNIQPRLFHFQFAVGARFDPGRSEQPGQSRLYYEWDVADFNTKYMTMSEKRGHEQSPSRQGVRPRDKANGKRAMKRSRRGGKQKSTTAGSPEEVLLADVQAAIAAYRLSPPPGESKDEEGVDAPCPSGRPIGEGTEPVAGGEGKASVSATATALPEQGSEIEVEVFALSSTGEGLARQPGGSDRIYVVPYVVPGDRARVRVWREVNVLTSATRGAGPSPDGDEPLPDLVTWTTADFLSVVRASPQRDDSRIKCQYFGQCPGCQFQMLSYADQLRHKREIVVLAYRRFSDLPPELVPPVLDTVGSPLQYGYRTKLSPHFDGPPGYWRKHNRTAAQKPTLAQCPPIGFTSRMGRKVMDIEDCPIGTEAVRRGMTRERARIRDEFGRYTKGATILLRESTRRVMKKGDGVGTGTEEGGEEGGEGIVADPHTVRVETDTHVDYKTCITDNNATSTEYVDDFVFENPAGSFFQNNNSILTPFTEYIREHIIPPATAAAATTTTTAPPRKPIRYLIDAYSGSGLFTITLSSLFPGGSVGIDIAERSIACARRNAFLNGLAPSPPAPSPSSKSSTTAAGPRSRSPLASVTPSSPSPPSSSTPRCTFIAADANALFAQLPEGRCHPDETVVVLDPPRKGCDEDFLQQLLRFAPARVVYVSCNVHTQARDVGLLVRGEADLGAGDRGDDGGSDGKQNEKDSRSREATGRATGTRYDIESIRGFDFFPQTGHVEGVAILNRVDE